MSPSNDAHSLIESLRADKDLGVRLVAAYRAEIPEYLRLSDQVLERDILPMATALVEQLMIDLGSSEEIDRAFESELRNSAARRFHQGVPLDALMHSYRLWGRIVWKVAIEGIDHSDHEQLNAGLELAERIMQYLDQASVVVSQAYTSEVVGSTHDRSILHGEVLDALLGGDFATEEVERQVASVASQLRGRHIVLDIIGGEYLGAGSTPLRSLISDVHAHLHPSVAELTLGARSNELVVIYPMAPTDTEALVGQEIDRLSSVLVNLTVGVGRPHEGSSGLTMGYKEAAESASFGDSMRWYGRAIRFRDVLLDHIARTSRYSVSLISDTLAPLETYDQERGTNLVETFQTFYASRYSLTRAAKSLHVHPNTVTYRLRRIQELTGLDPAEPDELLLLSLGLKFWLLNRPGS